MKTNQINETKHMNQKTSTTRSPWHRKGLLGQRANPWHEASDSPGGRLPWERITHIHQAVERGEYPNATTLAAALGVSTKTTARDLAYMQQRLQLPLQYAPARHGYFYPSGPGQRPLPCVSVAEPELFALLIAGRLVAQYRGTPQEPHVRTFCRKFMLFLDPNEFIPIPDLRGDMSMPLPADDFAAPLAA
ncbi:MAG TPA: hypothetical protein VI136_12265 [Verrucomicrobiae bacterium]